MSARTPTKKATKKRQAARDRRMEWLALGMIGLGAVLLVAGLFVLGIFHVGPRAPELTGAIVNGAPAAPDFQLTDQFGQPVALSSFKGKVVVLTFLYTNCPDACPLITMKMGQAYDMLGADAMKVQLLAITVDPERDTVAQVHQFSAEKNMLQKWHFLVGPQAQLAPIWQAYGIGADRGLPTTPAPGTPAAGSYTIDHSAPIFVIDPALRERVLLDVDFQPADLVQDARALLR